MEKGPHIDQNPQENNWAKKQQELLSELISLEDIQDELAKKLSKLSNNTDEFREAFENDDAICEVIIENGEEEEIATELKRIREDIELKVLEIEAAEAACLGALKSFDEISGEIGASSDDSEYEDIDSMVDEMFPHVDENDSGEVNAEDKGTSLEEEIELRLNDIIG